MILCARSTSRSREQIKKRRSCSENMLFLTNGFICLFYENKCMLISGGHILNTDKLCDIQEDHTHI